MPGDFPTVVAVEPVGYCVRDELPPGGRWQMAWRGFGTTPVTAAQEPSRA